MSELRVMVFSGAMPQEPYRLLDRIEREVPGARVAGLVLEVRRPKPLSVRARSWLRNLAAPGYLGYVGARIGARVAGLAAETGHACCAWPRPAA